MSEGSGERKRSISRLRWIGYGLLLISLFDTVQIFILPQFMNPIWEFQTIGVLVERLPVPLLGLAMVFFGEDQERGGWETGILKLLSTLCLVLAVVFLLMIPLGIVDTFRINELNNKRIEEQSQRQLDQLTNVETQVSRSTPQDLQNIANELGRLGFPVNNQKPEQLKEQILSRLANAKKQAEPQLEEARGSQRTLLLKNSVKWNLGALVGSVLFYLTWRSTPWVKRLGK